MSNPSEFHIAVLPGDGIGPEVMAPCQGLLDHVASKVGGFALRFETLPAGAAHYRDTGVAYPDTSRAVAASADAILLGAMGLPDVRYPDGTEISPQLDLRFDLELYAGVRPVRAVPGLNYPLADPRAKTLDFVLIRESIEGLFASRGKGTLEDNQIATDTLVITRDVSEKLFDFSFDLARRRKEKGHPGNVTCVDKANVFRSFAFFRSIFDERAALNPDLGADHAYVDATALNMVRGPWAFDVLVTENMFGDILSDLGAGLIGGMGMAPSADIGDNHAVFQPCHGTAPDIVGTGKANPTAMILSAAMMLDWLGDKHENAACNQAADLIVAAVDRAFEGGDLVPNELGGDAGTDVIFKAVYAAIEQLLAAQAAAE
ncbi:MAG: isocitrate/isopropylmalate dehydrogenase family protein [Alphaproteobacteria bacterium]|jgi:3-isopropylmalate dehydrogenase|nr:isocitrate/isopropylmalate dehydrogenase family protein [Alphaproteobacteria bacterium]MBT4020383.1 isocitrate/isopropylmalate dehydrogenase family protein [Alphaproteobacteria bacterium]MBT4965539.1 isocitrate/isopropylmalate dehydrogenase family protein [Alphaproteobacteria bacterium]MBT5160374.1 isocitrate/isopropylmalate dehydrogenase family protein [Alphaproteobacteria bacterium]MBT5917309.1 isocitrate/isopropylmalate dehydrogenase family protein [Alphaproteobacteria bacterium]